MPQRNQDLATLAFTAPMVMAARTMQMATGGMSQAEFARMWVEKPTAIAQSIATMQTEAAMATMAAFGNPFFRRKGWDAVMATGLRPFAKAVSANHKRLSR